MDTITTPAAVYSPPSTAILHNSQASLTDRAPTAPVHLVQYDQTAPIIAVSLTENDSQYTIPTGAAVNVRMDKPDGKHVYDPALGISADRKTVYIGVTVQMTTAWGRSAPIIEIVVGGGTVGSASFPVIIDENPVPDSAIESTDEFLTIQQIFQQVEEAAAVVQQNAQNLQNLTDNLEAVQNAAGNAQAAAASAAAAQQAAQEALGFRTFFSAVTPDENGDLDPSRPMATPTAASVTVKSKGDRIQSVQVNGFTTQVGTGDPSPTNVREISTAGMRMVEVTFDGSSDEGWTVLSAGKYYLSLENSSDTKKPIYSTRFEYTAVFTSVGQVAWGGSGTTSNKLLVFFTTFSALDDWKEYLKNNPLTVWYVPADESQATGLYIPVETQGHEYRCQCLELTAPLCDGDKVESCVPSGCDKRIVFDGSADENWTLSGSQVPGYVKAYLAVGNVLLDSAYSNWLPHGEFGTDWIGNLSKEYVTISDSNENICVQIKTDGDQTIDNLRAILSAKALIVFCKSTTYSDSNQINAELETHASGAVYAHPSVELVAVPYTDADVAAANQLASTPTTLPYIDSADVPMLLDSAEPAASAASLASTLPVAGTYVVSSQDGATVAVTLKAFQDGGDAATLGGMTAVEAMLNFVYPVGSIYMSVNNVSPQTFLGGTWQQIQGQFLLAASGSYPAGSTGGEANHALTEAENGPHNHTLDTRGSLWGWDVGTTQTANIQSQPNGAEIRLATGANFTISQSGSGQPHNNMPPYLAVYMWQRTS